MTGPRLRGADRPAPPDPGLQPERTCLAWSRTAFVAAVNALLLLRGATMGGNRLMLAGGVLCLILAGMMWLWGYGRLTLDKPRRTAFGQGRWIMALTALILVSISALTALSALNVFNGG
ncbi:DUF202 domain-containing protein [Acerihabitans sp.]|uniref:DUF202 domain-containing protein n=1 Tax=Acerihabitans sp. TaxID=2811394 RepID=UPI002EDB5B75